MSDHQIGLEMGSQRALVTEPLSVSLLSPAHAEGLRELSREADFAGAAGMGYALSEEGVAEYIASATKAQDDGRSYIFVLTRGTEVLGVCRLIGVLGVPRLIVSIGASYRGQGNGSLLVRRVLEFAFDTSDGEWRLSGDRCPVRPCEWQHPYAPGVAGQASTNRQLTAFSKVLH
jgi:GNAT superfamily N-acetyltransferase